MSDSLKYLTNRLKHINIIASQSVNLEILNSIEKFSENDFHKAYLLGYFFKHKFDSDNLTATDKKLLIDTIRSKSLETYFYLKTKPEKHIFSKLNYLFIIIGFIAIVVGIIQLIKGDFSYGLGTKYLVPIFREGGYKIILGLVFFISGLLWLKYEFKKKQFLKAFLGSTN